MVSVSLLLLVVITVPLPAEIHVVASVLLRIASNIVQMLTVQIVMEIIFVAHQTMILNKIVLQ
jgi:hypothetical protein